MPRIKNRFCMLAVAMCVVLVAAACANNQAGGSNSGSSAIQLALFYPLTGPLAASGQLMYATARGQIEKTNSQGGVAGHKLTYHIYDEKDAATAVADAREAGAAGTKYFVGFLSSADCVAVAPIAQQFGAVMVTATCTANSLYGRNRPEKMFMGMGGSDTLTEERQAQAIASSVKGLKAVDSIAYNYVVGRENIAGDIDFLAKRGVPLQTGRQYWEPLGSQDFSGDIQALIQGVGTPQPNRLLLVFVYGAGAQAFLKQAAQNDLSKYYGAVWMVGENAESGAALLGGSAPTIWSDAAYEMQYASGKAANTDYTAGLNKYGGQNAYPDGLSYLSWLSVKTLAAALTKAGGGGSPSAVYKALNGMTLKTPMGNVTYDTGQGVAYTSDIAFQIAGDRNEANKVKLLKYSLLNWDGGKPHVVANG